MHLVFDFDGTITKEDTIEELARSAIAHQKEHRGLDLQEKWDKVVQDYVDDYRRYKSEYAVPEGERTSLEQEEAFLRGLKDVEETSLVRVDRSGVFSGLEEVELVKAGMEAVSSGRVKIRDGFEEMLSLAEKNAWTVGVISVNWSRSFIHGVLQPHTLTIIANEFSTDGTIVGPSFLGCKLSNACEKKDALEHLIGDNSKDKIVYFGDSITDLKCLVDGGVVISDGDGSSLLKTLTRLGVDVPHVGGRLGRERVCWATDFLEVLNSGVLGETG